MAGAEWGGVLKNIYALGFGLLDGLGEGRPNLKAAFVTLALSEMKSIAVKMGAQEKTLEGLAGLGDLVTTGFSADSHNRRLGEFLAGGMEFEKAVAQLGGVVPEGVKATSLVLETLGASISMPLARAIFTCLNQPAARPRFVDEVWKITD
jgi:glycerol-3-phosphate dehydrogenase (NAD(P)+)